MHSAIGCSWQRAKVADLLSNTSAAACPPGQPLTQYPTPSTPSGLYGGPWFPQAYPLDLVRTRLAAQTGAGAGYYHGIGGTLRRIVADEGALGLYRGLGATLLQVCGGGSGRKGQE